jgi:hypothetical protein
MKSLLVHNKEAFYPLVFRFTKIRNKNLSTPMLEIYYQKLYNQYHIWKH